MKKTHLLIVIAYLSHLAAWFLPVEKYGDTFPTYLPGWEAFRVAASAVWPYDGFKTEAWYNGVPGTMSAVTTVLFVLGSGWVLAIPSRRLRRASAWIAACAFIVNAQWVLAERSDLRIGYFLWWASFLLLAIGLFRLSHATESR